MIVLISLATFSTRFTSDCVQPEPVKLSVRLNSWLSGTFGLPLVQLVGGVKPPPPPPTGLAAVMMPAWKVQAEESEPDQPCCAIVSVWLVESWSCQELRGPVSA